MARPWKHPTTGISWLRKAVLVDLRQVLDKRDEKFSLKTHHQSEAKIRLSRALARLRDVDRTRFYECLEAEKAGSVLPRGDGYAAVPDLRQAPDVLRRPNRLLEPVKIMPSERIRHALRHWDAPGAIHIDLELGAGCGLRTGLDRVVSHFTDLDVPVSKLQSAFDVAFHGLDVMVGQHAGVSIQRPAHASTQNLREGPIHLFAYDVPESDLNAGESVHIGSVPAQQMHGVQYVSLYACKTVQRFADH